MRSDTHSYDTVHDVDIASRSRSARPKGNLYDDKFFNQNVYDDYTQIVLWCTQTFKTTESKYVMDEGPSMIAKMKDLLDPLVKFEVDCEEVAKDVCNVLMHWQNNSTGGKRAFIPTLMIVMSVMPQ